MNGKEYVELSRLADLKDYSVIQERLSRKETSKLVHYFLGMGTESAELLDALKKSLMYGKTLDTVNIKEELGDVLWYIARTCDLLGVSIEEVMDLNIRKLKARYGQAFTEHAALNRDLTTERAVLEGHVK